MQLGPWLLEADVEATRAAYGSSNGIDPHCCNACATFALALESGVLPPSLLAALRALGIDPNKPAEAWGAPDGGFIQIWWPFIGTLRPRENSEGDESIVLTEGQSCRVTHHYPHPSWSGRDGQELPALELTWTSDDLRQLESRAWPPSST